MKLFPQGIELSNDEVLALKNDLLDIEQWILDAIKGKIESCKKRMIQSNLPNLYNDPDVKSIPGDKAELLTFISQHKDYKNREQKDLEERQKRDVF